MMNHKNCWGVVGLFIIMLVLSIPFYSAQALAASVQITKNSGEQNIPRYLDAQGDAWTVQATITGSGAETINPSDVKLKIGNNEAAFTSCSAGTLGIVCEYISPLSDGIQEAEYAFQVIYRFLNQVGMPDSVSNGEVIRADGSAPVVLITSLQENREGKVEIDFTVNDKVRQNAPAVGIKTIEIVDADSGNVLQTISITETGKEQYNYRNDGGFSGILQAPLAGEGLKRIKVRAVDWLGHESAAPVRVFRADFVAPVIKDNLNFTDFGRFVGEFVTTTDITVDVQESSILTLTATSNFANINGQEADCEEDLEQIGLWHCIWRNVEVNPLQDSISVDIVAKDEVGNIAAKTVTKTFTRDVAAPTVSFFGTEKVFDGKSYVRTGRQRLILKVNDQGAGITANGIRANLLALGKSNSEAPTECTSTDAGLECYWDTSASLTSGVARVGLSKFEDNVGNLGSVMEAELAVDNSGPKVEKVELYGGDKDYVQSNDQLKLRVKAIESSGMVILVNVNNLVMDAETKFPETPYTRTLVPTTGWQAFTENSCEKTEGGYWDCEIFTDPVRSGPENNVEITVHVQDTAGNEAVEWPQEAKNAEIRSSRNSPATLKFDLLGLSTEENPDYWEISSVRPMQEFVDISSTHLAPLRFPVKVELSSQSSVSALNIQLLDCAPSSRESSGNDTVSFPELSRTLMYGTSGETSRLANPTIVLEFAQFDGMSFFNVDENQETVKFPRKYTCSLRIFSEIDDQALANAETQEVDIEVSFALSSLGAQDQALQEKIDDARDTATNVMWTWTDELQQVLDWINFINNLIIQPILILFHIIDGVKIAISPAQKAPPLYAAITGSCFSVTTSQAIFRGVYETIEPFVGILTCNDNAPLVGKWHGAVLDWYNLKLMELPGHGAIAGITSNPRRAVNLDDNILLSTVGLCIPGIITNLNRLREIYCRNVYCLENEVAGGMPVSVCESLKELQICKYVVGDLMEMMPWISGIFNLLDVLKSLLSDYIGTALKAAYFLCATKCPTDTATAGLCSIATVGGEFLRLWGLVNSALQSRSAIGQSYCSIIED